MSKDLFDKDKNASFQRKETEKQELLDKTQKVRDSISTSLTKLQETYPKMSQSVIKGVSKAMADGSYRNMFFNADGTFTQEAASRFALALYGDEEIRSAAKEAASKAGSDATKRVVERADIKPSISDDGAQPENKNKVPSTQSSFLNSILSNRTSYEAKVVK